MKIEMKPDEREGWTSASSAEADSLCPGRHIAQRGLPEPEQGEDAHSGNRIHAWLAGENVELSDEEMETALKCREIEKGVLAKVFPNLDPETGPQIREDRLWLDHPKFEHSGKPDVVYLMGDSALILDYKTGRNEVEESPKNMQLRDLAVLAWRRNARVSSVFVAVIQPWVTSRPEICGYTYSALVKATLEIYARIEASNSPDSKRIPGPAQCQFCKAKATCKEAREYALTPIVAEKNHVANLTSEHLAECLDRIPAAERIFDAIREEAERRIAQGEIIPGYAMKEGAKTSKITNPQECFNRAAARGVTVESFMSCVTVAKGKLASALKSATGEKGKALEDSMESVLTGICEDKQNKPSLVKVKQ